MVIGFALRFNPLLVVVVAGLTTGLLVGMDFGMLLETFGEVRQQPLSGYIHSDPAGYWSAGILRSKRARTGVGGEDRQRHFGAYSDDHFVAREGRPRWG